MRIVLIADTFPPLRSSGAIQLYDLAIEFLHQGHNITVLLPETTLSTGWDISVKDNIRIVRLKSPQTKDTNYLHRTINEFLMPFFMLKNFYASPLSQETWDGIVWYSPTIFLGPIIKNFKKRNLCRSYLILRDIFPQWAVDLGLIYKHGILHRIFKKIEFYQYSIADIIGVQTYGNLEYFLNKKIKNNPKIEVLHNWHTQSPHLPCDIDISETILAGRTIFLYAGNMGKAQGMDTLIQLVANLRNKKNIGFLFIGRGSLKRRLQRHCTQKNLDNVLFFDEISPLEIPSLYKQCHIGLVALDTRHKTHNIPGKFISYIYNGLPVLAIVNPGNDLVDLINKERIGKVCETPSVPVIKQLATSLVDEIQLDKQISARAQEVAKRLFSTSHIVKQIIKGLE